MTSSLKLSIIIYIPFCSLFCFGVHSITFNVQLQIKLFQSFRHFCAASIKFIFLSNRNESEPVHKMAKYKNHIVPRVIQDSQLKMKTAEKYVDVEVIIDSCR